ncbi:peptidyl-trna hydrolase pth2 domain-containing protein [Cystoisospora suis]|uniref:peptidyl-tRNA hydrolase n=1 Tax=Cystoisospora suis TaxID=483139 RepID=A0A2C6L9V7_9APIC|nr:peptidyl-trna hydrolase pth2 domain-containing protein [Cystoisospora suis]
MLLQAEIETLYSFRPVLSQLLRRLVPWRHRQYGIAFSVQENTTAPTVFFNSFAARRSKMDVGDVPHAAHKQPGSITHPLGVTLPSTFDTAGITRGNSFTRGKKGGSPQDPLVQYVVVRKDLQVLLGWTTGAVVAQACHACVSVVGSAYSAPEVQAYLAEGDCMRKVVLEVNSEEELRSLSETLQTKGVPHKLWVEQPEEIATCLAVQPLPKSQVQPHLKKLKLFS